MPSRFRCYLSGTFNEGLGFSHWIDEGQVEQLGGVELVRCGRQLCEPSSDWHETKAAALRWMAEEILSRISALRSQASEMLQEAQRHEAHGCQSGPNGGVAASVGER